MHRLAFVLLVLAPSIVAADKRLEKGAVHDCKTDPVVSIPNGKGTYTFKGHCTKISLGGGLNTLTIDELDELSLGGGKNTIVAKSIDQLNIGGAKNTITVDTVGAINVGGAENTITWKKAKAGAKPKLSGQADKNTITQSK